MPLFGAHMSIAGGHHNALLAAQGHGRDTVQLFTKSTNQWRAKELTEEDVAVFPGTLRQSGLRIPIGHDSYLLNLGSPGETLYQNSTVALRIELVRAEHLVLR